MTSPNQLLESLSRSNDSIIEMPPKRMTANQVAPLRYRPGKPVGNDEPSSESDSESDEEVQRKPAPRQPPPKAASFPKITSDLQARDKAAAAAKAKELERRKAEEEGFVTASESEEEEEQGSEEDDEDEESEEDESSDEDAKPRFVAPTFIPKHKRAAQAQVEKQTEDDKWAAEEQRRIEKADEMLRAQIERDARIRAEGRRDWDDEDNVVDEVDDTDDVDPEAERAAWKLRELKRVKREREAIEVAEKEREEIERRRNLTAEERKAEDEEYLAKQAEERGEKGQMGFMQKYFHKGAFFQGDEGEAGQELAALKDRDIMGARYEGDAVNRELLPQYMQIRDLSKLGKKGRTRYRDMKSEDTGRWGADLDRRRDDGANKYDREGPSGANAAAVGERRRRDDDRGGRDEKRPRYDR